MTTAHDDTLQPVLPFGYTAEDIERGYTLAHGREGRTERKAIPADILLVVELRLLRAQLAQWLGAAREEPDASHAAGTKRPGRH
jgi:hypothetical protein